jgi:hypothetical protein
MLHKSLNDCVQALEAALLTTKIPTIHKPIEDENIYDYESPLAKIHATRPAGLPSSKHIDPDDWWGNWEPPVIGTCLYFNYSFKIKEISYGRYSNARGNNLCSLSKIISICIISATLHGIQISKTAT